MLDITKPIRTRGTHFPARIVCTDKKGSFPLVVLVEYGSDIEIIACYSIEGIGDGPGTWNIENVPLQDWRAIFRDGQGRLCVTVSTYPTEEEVLNLHSTGASFVCAVKVSKD